MYCQVVADVTVWGTFGSYLASHRLSLVQKPNFIIVFCLVLGFLKPNDGGAHFWHLLIILGQSSFLDCPESRF